MTPRMLTRAWSSVASLDKPVKRLAIIAVLAIFACGILAQQVQILRAQSGIRASCQFWADAAVAPLVPQTSKAVLTLVADARNTYHQQNCTPPLPDPDPLLLPYLKHGDR